MTKNIMIPSMNREVKASVFSDLFQIPKYAKQLYQVFHPEDTDVQEDSITDITIHSVLTDVLYNDLGLCVGDHTLLLLEAQSTWTLNIVLRIMEYLMHTYSSYCAKQEYDLYQGTPVQLPKPELYVLYTGETKDIPEVISFSETFFPGQDICIDAKVRVIRDSKPGDILNQYVIFTKIADEQVKKYGRTKEAAEETVRICIEQNILTEYLEERKSDVMDIMTTLFDQETVFKNTLKRVGKEENVKGKLEEIISSIEEGDYSIERGAEKAGMTVDELRRKALLLFDKKI